MDYSFSCFVWDNWLTFLGWINSEVMEIAKIGILIGFTFVNAFYDNYKINKGLIMDKNVEGFNQLLFCLSLSFLMVTDISTILTGFVLYIALFWLVFDYLLNKIRGLSWWHLGSGPIDSILKGYNLRYFRLIVKIIFVVFAIGLKIYFNGF